MDRGSQAWQDAMIGGWQTVFNMFAKTGTLASLRIGFAMTVAQNLGNIGVESVDAVG